MNRNFKRILILAMLSLFCFSILYAQQTEEKKYAVALEASIIRAKPSVKSSVVFVAEPGEKMEIIEDLGNWLKVKKKTGEVGYILARLVQVEIVKIVKIPVKEEKPPAKEKIIPKKPQVAKPVTKPVKPAKPITGVKLKEGKRNTKKLIIIAGGVLVTGAVAYALFRKGGLLNKGKATLNVTSDPSPAVVYVDDEEKCTTPCLVEDISPGTHKIRIERPLYGKWEEEMELKGHTEYTINATLSPFKYQFKSCFGRGGSIAGQFNSPTDLTIDGNGNLYVADTGNNRIQKFSKEGYYIARTGLTNVSAIRFFPSNKSIYAATLTTNYLRRYTLDLAYMWQKYIALSYPRGMGADNSGNLYIADTAHNKILVTGPQGGIKKSWRVGSGNTLPYDAEPGPNGDIYVTAYNADRIFVYSSSGVKKKTFSRIINGPAELAIDTMGHVYVTAYFENKVYKFTPEGKFTLGFGGGTLLRPVGIAAGKNGNIFVVDNGHNRVCIWSLSSETIGTGTAKIQAKYKKGSSGNSMGTGIANPYNRGQIPEKKRTKRIKKI